LFPLTRLWLSVASLRASMLARFNRFGSSP
jgi:hypothetical protein